MWAAGRGSVDDIDDVGSRLALDIEDQCGRGVHPAAELGILGARHRGRQSLSRTGAPFFVGDHDLAVASALRI